MLNACVPDGIITLKQPSTAIHSGLRKKIEKMPEIFHHKDALSGIWKECLSEHSYDRMPNEGKSPL